MTGTLVNVGGIAVGSLIGLLLKKGIPEHINEAVMRAIGLSVSIIALNGMIGSMFFVADGRIKDDGGLLLLISLVIGCVIGELLKISDRIDAFGKFVETRFGASGFARGFISASLIFCIGAMTLIGALNDGLRGDSSVLLVKAVIDGVTALVLAASLGMGVIFAAVPVLLIQGSVSLLAGQLSGILTGPLLDSICMVGYALVLLIGLNLLLKTTFKVANFLPAMLVPVIWHLMF